MKKIMIITLFALFCTITSMAHAEIYSAGYEIVVDNSNIGNGFTCTEGFTLFADSAAYGGTARCVTTVAANTQKARWTPNIPINGYYRIYITYPQLQNTAATANIQIEYGNGSKYYAKNINPKYNTGEWVYLGTYYMPEGKIGNVSLKPNTDGAVAADAVKFVLSSTTENSDVINDVMTEVPYNAEETVLVQDRESGDHFLSIKGEPYYIKGVCKSGALDKVAAAGGNTIRTYSAMIANNTTKSVLDMAQSLGIKVVLGIDLPKETDSFTYSSNYDLFKSYYFENFKKQINEFKNHPALLMWAVGNEVDVVGCTEDVYKAINEVSEYIKMVDPYHPITSVHAGASEGKITGIMQYAPCVDVVSANVYKGIDLAYNHIITNAKWQGPYMITEYSVNQPSEELASENVVFGNTVIEKPDYLKAQDYYDRYINCIIKNRSKCLGSFAFATNDTYRGTHTWYNFFLESDYKNTTVYDALYYAWNGRKRDNVAPIVKSIKLMGRDAQSEIGVECGGTAYFDLEYEDKDGDQLAFKYEIRKSDMNFLPQPISGVTFETDPENLSSVKVSGLPSEEGIYRLYVYVYDGNGNIGYGNIPFRTISPSEGSEASKIAEEKFSGITALGEEYTSPQKNGFSGVWKTATDLITPSKMSITKLGDYLLASSTAYVATKNIFNEIVTPIDMDSDSDYYSSWIQGYTSLENDKFVKIGFTKKEDISQEISVLFRRTNDMHRLGIKIASEISYSNEIINTGSLYNVICRIQARATEEDIIYVKIWPVNCSQPYDWTYMVKSNLSGKFSIISMQADSANGSRAYFGNFSLESFSGYEKELMLNAMAAVGNYLTNDTEVPMLTDFSEMTSYDLIKDLIKLKDNAYIKEIAFYNNGTRMSNLPQETQGSMKVKLMLANDNGKSAGGRNDNYCACYDNNGRLIFVRSIVGRDYVCDALSEREVDFSVPVGTAGIKIFTWSETLQPMVQVTKIEQAGIINYE